MQFAEDPRRAEALAKSITDVADQLAIQGLRRAGVEMVGPCPQCGGDDRFGINPACRSRVECGSPSTGSEKMHKKEEAALIESVFAASDADGTLFESAPVKTDAKTGAKPAGTRS